MEWPHFTYTYNIIYTYQTSISHTHTQNETDSYMLHKYEISYYPTIAHNSQIFIAQACAQKLKTYELK